MGFRGGFIMDDKRFYTIKELTKEVDRTAATIYAFMRSDIEIQQFFYQHRQENTKGGYIYDEEALNCLKKRFGVASVEGIGENFSDNAKNPLPSLPPIDDELRQMSKEKERLSAELEELKGKFEALQADFEKVEGERVELLRQNGLKTDEINHLLLLLSQEKAEKQALLPPPRQTIGERIKKLFHSKDN
jgi:hypothetical protein